VFNARHRRHVTFQQETIEGFEWTSCPDFNCKTPKMEGEKVYTFNLDACLTNALNVIFGLSTMESYNVTHLNTSDFIVFAIYQS